MLRRSLQGLALAVAIGVGFPGPTAEATSLAELTVEQKTDASTYIVRGQVESIWSELDERGHVWTRALVDVSEVLKGPDQPDVLVVDTPGGKIGAEEVSIHLAARFSEGEEVLLFLAEVDFGRRLAPVAMAMGKYTVRRAPGETRHHLMQWSRSQEAYDHRFLPHPPAAERVYLDDLLDRVSQRLATGWEGDAIPGIAPERLIEINKPERRFRR